MFCYCYFTGEKRWYKEPQGGCGNGESRLEGEVRVAACTCGGHVSPCMPCSWRQEKRENGSWHGVVRLLGSFLWKVSLCKKEVRKCKSEERGERVERLSNLKRFEVIIMKSGGINWVEKYWRAGQSQGPSWVFMFDLKVIPVLYRWHCICMVWFLPHSS